MGKHNPSCAGTFVVGATLVLALACSKARADVLIVNETDVPLDVEVRIDDASTWCHGARIGEAPGVSVDFSASPDRVDYFWYKVPAKGLKMVWCGDATGRRIFAVAKKPDGSTLPDQTYARNFNDPAWRTNYYKVPYVSSESLSTKPAPGGHGLCSMFMDIYCRTNQCQPMLHYSGDANERNVSIHFKDCTYLPLHSPSWFHDPREADNGCHPMGSWDDVIGWLGITVNSAKASLPPGAKLDWSWCQ